MANEFKHFTCFSRALVGMMMFNAETNEIAKPSELLNSVKAIMSVLQSIENYGKEEDCGVKWMSFFFVSFFMHLLPG